MALVNNQQTDTPTPPARRASEGMVVTSNIKPLHEQQLMARGDNQGFDKNALLDLQLRYRGNQEVLSLIDAMSQIGEDHEFLSSILEDVKTEHDNTLNRILEDCEEWEDQLDDAADLAFRDDKDDRAKGEKKIERVIDAILDRRDFYQNSRDTLT